MIVGICSAVPAEGRRREKATFSPAGDQGAVLLVQKVKISLGGASADEVLLDADIGQGL